MTDRINGEDNDGENMLLKAIEKLFVRFGFEDDSGFENAVTILLSSLEDTKILRIISLIESLGVIAGSEEEYAVVGLLRTHEIYVGEGMLDRIISNVKANMADDMLIRIF